MIGLWRGTLSNLAKVAPYAGLMFFFNEVCKNYYYCKNGYTTSYWKPIPKEGIDQSWSIQEVKAYYAAQAKKEAEAKAAPKEETPKVEEAPKEETPKEN